MGSSKLKDSNKLILDSGKYARYTPEQVEILERVYNETPKPSSSRRQQLIKDCPILANIGQKQLKVWFQNRRCREKQRKETGRLQNWNSKLNAMNQILLEENERLQKQAAQLSVENQYLKQQLQLQQPHVDLNFCAVLPTANETSSESVVTSGQHQHSPQHVSQELNAPQVSALAEKILAEFLAKASGGMVKGIPLPGMKPGPDSFQVLAFPLSGGRVAAQASGFVNLGAFKVADIIKNRPLWHQDCRKQDIKASYPQNPGGLVELVHTQMYAPTMLSTARDFWTLRYTCLLEDGNLVVCEGSLASAAGHGLQDIPSPLGFVRAEMLPSGALIRACDQGGSLVMAIDDMNFMSGSQVENLQPLYDTSALLAWRVTYKVLCHLGGLANEKAELGLANNPSSPLHGFSHQLSRGFNDAINCFPDDGWLALVNDGPGTVTVHLNPPQSFKQMASGSAKHRGTICAKASLLLHNVPPPILFSFLKERLVVWADFDADSNFDDLSKAKRKLSSVNIFQPVSAPNEVLEVIRLQKAQESDRFLLQLCNTMEDTAASAYAQLIFAPFDASMPDDTQLLPSGFRIMHLEACVESLTSQTLDLASSLEDRSTNNRMQLKSLCNLGSSVTICFQFPYELDSREVALKAQRNVQALVDLLQHVAITLCPQRSVSVTTPPCGVEALLLVRHLADSYRLYIGHELLSCTDGSPEGLFKNFWVLRHAIFCCAWKPLPEFIFANHAALEMLESSMSDLRDMSLEKMFRDASGRKTDYSQPPPFLQKGYADLPGGYCFSSTGRHVSFEHATGWKVNTGDQNMQIAAFMFVNWSFSNI